MTILGARPQFIKAAAISRAIARLNCGEVQIEELIVHTGQHYDADMSDVFFREMDIPQPDYNLNINGLSQGAMTGQMLEKLEQLMVENTPTIVLVYGDTNSTLSAALSARKLNIPLVHIEGGLRNFDLTIPEDVNRILTDRMSDLIFYSTDSAVRNLMNEGYADFPTRLKRTGDLMADTVFYYSNIARQKSRILTKLDLIGKKFILLTVHRVANVKEASLNQIVKALNSIKEDGLIIFPVHPNTRNKLEYYQIKVSKNIVLINPVGYFDMLELLRGCHLVITDSGGLQREAYLANKKSLNLMEYTPWEELVTNDFSCTTKIKSNDILENFRKLKKLCPDFSKNLYGDGNTAETIVTEILSIYGENYTGNI